MANLTQTKRAAANVTRIQGGTGEVTIGADVVHRIVAAVPSAGSGGTVTVERGTTTILVFEAAANDLKTMELEYHLDDEDLNITPSDASIDLSVFWS